jgi:hypothetical protein
MPNPKANESEQDFVARCVPVVMKEGKTQEQALGACYGIFRSAKKKTASIDRAIAVVKKNIRILEDSELRKQYQPEIDEVMKAHEDIPESGKKLLASVYAKCRKSGGEKEYSARVAWSVVNREVMGKSDMQMLKSLEAILKDMRDENKNEKVPNGEDTPRPVE